MSSPPSSPTKHEAVSVSDRAPGRKRKVDEIYLTYTYKDDIVLKPFKPRPDVVSTNAPKKGETETYTRLSEDEYKRAALLG